MNKTILVMGHEVRATLGRKTFLLFAFGLPILLGAIAVVLMIVNRGATALPETPTAADTDAQVQGYVDNSGLIVMTPVTLTEARLRSYRDVADAEAGLTDGEIDGYYLIPADYGTGGQVVYVTDTYSPFADELDPAPISWLLLVNLLGDEQQARAVREPLVVEVTVLAPQGDAESESWIVELMPMMMVFLLYMVILIPAGSLVNAITDEKKNRVMETVLTSVSPRQFISGKVVALGLLGLVQILLWIGVFWGVARFGGQPLNIPPGFELPPALMVWALVYGLLGYAMYGVLMAGLGALAPDFRETRGASLVLMSPLIIAYLLNVAVLAEPDGLLAVVLSFFPLTSPISMISRMTATAVPLWQLLLAAFLQALTAALLLRLVTRMFRAQQLLSGQPFSVGRYFRIMLRADRVAG